MDQPCYNTLPPELTPEQLTLAIKKNILQAEELITLALDTARIDDYSKHLISFDRMAQELAGPSALDGHIHTHISAYLRQHVSSPFIQEAMAKIRGFQGAQMENLFKVEVLSSSSLEAVVLTGLSPSRYPLFAIKTPKTFKNEMGETIYVNLAPEAAIGLLVTNAMRQWTPCFSYFYDYTRCSLPQYVGHEVISWCDYSGPGAIILEYVPGLRLAEAMDYFDSEQLFRVLLLIVQTLKLSYAQYRFIHGDLHSANVLVRDFGRQVKLKVGEVTVVTQYVPYLIDFGFSAAKVPGADLIGSNSPAANDPELSGETYDLIRLLLTIAPLKEGRVQTDHPLYPVLQLFYSMTGRDYLKDVTTFLNVLSGEEKSNFIYFRNLYQETRGRKYQETSVDKWQDQSPLPLTEIYSQLDSCQFIVPLERGPRTAADLCELSFQGYEAPIELQQEIAQKEIIHLLEAIPMPDFPFIQLPSRLPPDYQHRLEQLARVEKRARDINYLVNLKNCGLHLSERQVKSLQERYLELYQYISNALNPDTVWYYLYRPQQLSLH